MPEIDRRFLKVNFTIDGIFRDNPPNVTKGMQILVDSKPTVGGLFENNANQIAYYDGIQWNFYKNFEGQFEVYNIEDKKIYRYEKNKWVSYEAGGTASDYVIRKVDNIAIGVGTNAPLGSTAKTVGDVYINPASNTIYEVTSPGVWSVTPLVEASCYAFGNHIYTVKNSEIVDDVTNEDIIVASKKNDNLYMYTVIPTA